MVLSIISYLGKSESKYVVVPLITIILGLVLRLICQSDKFVYSHREYFYWAPNLLTSALLVIFLDYCNHSQVMIPNKDAYVDGVMTAFIVWFCTLFIVIEVIRKWGWSIVAGRPRPTLLGGIIVPDAIGIMLLYSVLLIMES